MHASGKRGTLLATLRTATVPRFEKSPACNSTSPAGTAKPLCWQCVSLMATTRSTPASCGSVCMTGMTAGRVSLNTAVATRIATHAGGTGPSHAHSAQRTSTRVVTSNAAAICTTVLILSPVLATNFTRRDTRAPIVALITRFVASRGTRATHGWYQASRGADRAVGGLHYRAGSWSTKLIFNYLLYIVDTSSTSQAPTTGSPPL